MVKVLIAYDTKYGNTKRVAEIIAEGLMDAGITASVENMKDVNFREIGSFDIILMGSPNHIGRPTGTFKKFVKNLRKSNLADKTLVAFDTYVGQKDEEGIVHSGGGEFRKALLKMENHLREKLPQFKLITPGLSIAVSGMKGPIVETDILKSKEFGQKLASQLQ